MEGLFIPRIGDDRVKDKILGMLLDEHTLSLKELGIRISKSSNVTYQAVHKSLGELVEKGILDKEDNHYKISKTWVEKLKNFVKTISENDKDLLEKLKKGEIVKLNFTSQNEFAKFILGFIPKLISQKSKVDFIINNWHIYNMLWLSGEELSKFKNWENILNIYILCDADSNVDKWLAKSWEGIGAKISYGANNCKTNDFIIIEDYCLEIHWNKEIKEMWDKQRNISVEEYNAFKGISHINTDFPMTCIIMKDIELAEEIRERTLLRFK
jgi:hypothetical protein